MGVPFEGASRGCDASPRLLFSSVQMEKLHLQRAVVGAAHAITCLWVQGYLNHVFYVKHAASSQFVIIHDNGSHKSAEQLRWKLFIPTRGSLAPPPPPPAFLLLRKEALLDRGRAAGPGPRQFQVVGFFTTRFPGGPYTMPSLSVGEGSGDKKEPDHCMPDLHPQAERHLHLYLEHISLKLTCFLSFNCLQTVITVDVVTYTCNRIKNNSLKASK